MRGMFFASGWSAKSLAVVGMMFCSRYDVCNLLETEKLIMTKTTTSLIGKRIRLVRTDDPYTKLVAGDLGVITNVRDDLWGNSIVNVDWDSGSSLSLIEGEDSFTIVSEREQFATALENFVQSTLELSLAWERLDEQFAEYLNTLDWGFTSSLDEYVHELSHLRHKVLDAIRQSAKEN